MARFRFEPRWKEELVCRSEHGAFGLELTMGPYKVYLPRAELWALVAPPWARGEWDSLRDELQAWCDENRIRLVINDSAAVYPVD